VAIGSVWKLMYNYDFGIFNQALVALVVSPVNWLGSPSLALMSVIVVDVWHWVPFVFLILFAAVEGLPVDVLEAARIDGASRWQLIRRVQIPLLRPAIVVALLFRSILAFKVFDEVYLLTSGGPGTATELVNHLRTLGTAELQARQDLVLSDGRETVRRGAHDLDAVDRLEQPFGFVRKLHSHREALVGRERIGPAALATDGQKVGVPIVFETVGRREGSALQGASAAQAGRRKEFAAARVQHAERLAFRFLPFAAGVENFLCHGAAIEIETHGQSSIVEAGMAHDGIKGECDANVAGAVAGLKNLGHGHFVNGEAVHIEIVLAKEDDPVVIGIECLLNVDYAVA
jgi:hypothetical protein